MTANELNAGNVALAENKTGESRKVLHQAAQNESAPLDITL